MSLDTKDKLLTGRKFLKMTSRPILGAKEANLEWSCFGPNKQGRNSPLLSGQNEEAKGLFWKNRSSFGF